MKIIKIISDILPVPSYSVIIICFFLPFLTVKCGEMELLSVSGFEMAKGVDFEEKMKDSDLAKSLGKDFGDFGQKDDEESTYNEDFSDEDEDSLLDEEENVSVEEKNNVKKDKEVKSKKSEPSFLLIFPFILAIIGFIISFVKIKSKAIIHIVISGVLFFSLLVFGILLKNNNELSMLDSFDNGGSGLGLKEGMIKVSLGGAYYVSCILSLLLVFYFGLITYLNKQNILLPKDSLATKYNEFSEDLEEEKEN